MAEEPRGIFNESSTRRRFLKGLVKGGIALTGASLGLGGCTPKQQPEQRQTPTPEPTVRLPTPTSTKPASPTVPPKPSPEPSPTKEPMQFLTEEELQKANIRIIQTPKVTLKMEKGIFDFPLFKDAKEGKIKEAVIVLVGSPSISWAASEKLPEDAKLVWQAVNIHPKEYPDEFWKYRQEYTEKMVKLLKEELQLIQKQANLNTNPNLKYFFEGLIWDEKSSIWDYEQSLFFLTRGKEAAIRIAEERGITWPDGESYGQIIRLGTDYDRFPTPGIQKKFQDFPETAKRFKELKGTRPELFGKAFVYCVVGGVQKPLPEQSYPKPGQFKEKSNSSKGYNSYKYLAQKGSAGSTLRHEISHYITDSQSADEYEADTKMFDSIQSAWQRKQLGDKRGYPFHFFTAEGEIITKKQQFSQVQAV